MSRNRSEELGDSEKRRKELVFLILDLLKDEKCEETIHKIEQESGYFFNMKYFEEKVMAGDWDEIEKYLSGFTNVDDNRFSRKIYFDIRSQKYLEALDSNDKAKAVEVLAKDLKVLSTVDEDLYRELAYLLTLDNIRQNEITVYSDTVTMRAKRCKELKMLIEANPAIQDKLDFPTFEQERLKTLINQGFNWQHATCSHPRTNPRISTILEDHTCTPTKQANVSTELTLQVREVAYPAAHCLARPTAKASNPNALAGDIADATVSSSSWSRLANTSPVSVLPNLGQDMCTTTDTAHIATSLTLSVGAVAEPAAYNPASADMLTSPSIATTKAPNTNALEGSLTDAPQFSQGAGFFGCKRLDQSSPAWPSPVCKGSYPAIDESRTLNDAAADEGKLKELTEIAGPSTCRVVTIPAGADPSNKVAQILYTNSGRGILSLGSKGIQKLWNWNCTDQNPNGKATASIAPQQYQSMMNDVLKVNLRQAVPCIALSRTDELIISSCGGSVTLFSTKTFKALKSFLRPPPTPISLAFYPKDDNIVVIGMSNKKMYIYNVSTDEVKAKLRGHQRRITGLAFSTSLNILVSSSGDDLLIIWNTNNWKKRGTRDIRLSEATPPFKIEFHPDQVRLLVFCKTVLAMYDSPIKWNLIQKWVSKEAVSASLSCATFSCNGQVVYAAFCDGNVGVFDAESLRLTCRIFPSAYLPSAALISEKVAPVAIAAHPEEPNQFALGMTDGTIRVIEPD